MDPNSMRKNSAVCMVLFAACLLVVSFIFLVGSVVENGSVVRPVEQPSIKHPCEGWERSRLLDRQGQWVWQMPSLRHFFDYIEQPLAFCREVRTLGGVPMEKGNKLYVKGGKAVCFDPPFALKSNDCVVCSFTVNNELWTFEETLAKRGCSVYVFDPEKYDENLEALHPNIKANKYRIGDNDEAHRRGSNGFHEWRRMSSILDMLNAQGQPAHVDYLKIDTDGDELNFLSDMTQRQPGVLSSFTHINMVINLGVYGTPSWQDAAKYYRHFVSLEKRNFRLFSSRVEPMDHDNYMLHDIDRVVNTHYDLVWAKCEAPENDTTTDTW